MFVTFPRCKRSAAVFRPLLLPQDQHAVDSVGASVLRRLQVAADLRVLLTLLLFLFHLGKRRSSLNSSCSSRPHGRDLGVSELLPLPLGIVARPRFLCCLWLKKGQFFFVVTGPVGQRAAARSLRPDTPSTFLWQQSCHIYLNSALEALTGGVPRRHRARTPARVAACHDVHHDVVSGQCWTLGYSLRCYALVYKENLCLAKHR